MKICVVIPPFTTLPVQGHGGTERIAQGMIDELVRRGHHVTLLGAGRCRTKAHFVPLFDQPISGRKFDSALVESSRPLRLETAYIAMVMRYLQEHDGEFDVIFNHMRGGYLLLPLTRYLQTPIISIMHLPLFEEAVEALRLFPSPNIISISNAQRKPAKGNVNFLATVYNGLELAEFPFNPKPRDYVLFVGAMGEHKSPHLAIEAAKRAKVPIVLAGGKAREPYFSTKVKPLIDGKQIRFEGEVEGKKRIELYRNARALLMPITWEEPFGLVMIEAMACGTPVIGFRRGAVPEVVKNGKTGFLVNDVAEMATAIGRINEIDRAACRHAVEERFTYKKMVDGYLAAFAQLKR